MPHLKLCLTLLIMKRMKKDFPVTFILIFAWCQNWGNSKQLTDIIELVTLSFFLKKSCICICRPGGVLYSVDNLLTAHRRMLCLTASHSSASHTHIMDGLLLYLALLCK